MESKNIRPESKNIRLGLVIMASGLSKRFGSNKLMTPFIDKPLIKWIIDASEGLFDQRVIVTRSQEVKTLAEELGIDCIYHEYPGRNDTVRLGLSKLADRVDMCFFMPGDQPLLSRESLEKIICATRENPELITRPSHKGLPGSPVAFPRATFEELLNLPEGKGGGFVAKNHPDLINLVEIENEYELRDIDTPEDLEEIKQWFMQ